MVSNFFKYFPKDRISYFVYVSSDAVYGNIEKISNPTQANPTDLYGYMHLIREKYLPLILKNQKFVF